MAEDGTAEFGTDGQPIDESTTDGQPTDGGDDVYSVEHDMSRDGLSVTIAMALSEVSDREATDVIRDFSEYADPDALDRLFRRKPHERPSGSGHVRLEIAGHDVTVHSDGEIEIRPID